MASSGGGVHFSNKNWEGGYNFYLKFFWGGSVLKHYTFLKTTAPPWDVINDRSPIRNFLMQMKTHLRDVFVLLYKT